MNRPLFALALWGFVGPAVMLLGAAFEAWAPASSLTVRALATSSILVPVMVWVVVPALTRWLTRARA